MKSEEIVDSWFEIISSIRSLKASNSVNQELPYILITVNGQKIDELHLLDKAFTDSIKYMCKVKEVVFCEDSENPKIYFTRTSFQNLNNSDKMFLNSLGDLMVID